MKPLAIDLYCGLGGWAEGFLAEDYEVIGFDIERHDYGTGGYPGKLVLQDVTTLHGSQFRAAAVIVASPPCQAYSYRAMPWSRAKALPPPDNTLFEACFRIQREASEAVGRYIPLIVENVRGAQPWVGRAKANFGSYYLWGDVGMVGRRVVAGVPRFGVSVAPTMKAIKGPGGDWFKDGKQGQDACREALAQKIEGYSDPRRNGGKGSHLTSQRENDANKVAGLNWSGFGEPDYKPKGFNVTAAQRYREEAAQRVDESGTKGGGDWFGSGENCSLQRRFSGTKQAGICGPRNNGKGDKWFQDGAATFGSKSNPRKAASAHIAKIPFPLARYIAQVFKPEVREVLAS